MAYDYSGYASWEKVVAPNGTVYYVIPGAGRLYDPFLSASKGVPVTFVDPRPQVAEKNKAEAEKEKIRKQAERASSPLGQAAGLAGGVGGIVAGKWALDALGPATATEKLAEAELAKAAAGAVTSPASSAAAFNEAASVAGAGGDAMMTPVPAGFYDTVGGAGGVPGTATAPGMFSPSGIGSAGNVILPAVGAIGAFDVLSNKKHGAAGAFEGAASGAAMGSYFGLPGAAIGAAIGGTIGFFGNFGDVDAYKTEWKRKKALVDKGIITADQLGPEPMKGRSKEELIAEAQANGGNVTFAGSRNEDDLTPVDIQGYATVLEEAHRRGVTPAELAAQALNAKAVREHKGTVDVDWSKVPEGTVGAAPAQVTAAPPTKGAGVAQIQPGTPAAAQAASVITPPSAGRTQTLSPGIGLDGKRLTPEQMGKMLATRMNGR